jgi:hypothetical protein
MLGADGDRFRMTPGNFWSGYTTDLGAAAGEHYQWNERFRRDFECGMVLVNQPGMPSISVDLEQTFTTIAGQAVTAVTLPASSGSILSRACDAGTAVTAIDDTAEVSLGGSVVIDVLANDEGLDNGPFQLLITAEPIFGTTILSAEMQVVYTTKPDISGLDSFQYVVSDRDGSLSSAATVTVNIISSAEPQPAPEPAPAPPPEPADEPAVVTEDPGGAGIAVAASREAGNESNSGTASGSNGGGGAIDLLSITLLLSGFGIRRKAVAA